MFGIFGKTYLQVVELLPNYLLKKFWSVQVLIIITSFVDLFGLATFIPLLSAVANPSLISTNKYFSELKLFMGIKEDNQFLLILFIIALLFFVLRSGFILFSQWIQSKFVFQLSEYIGYKTFEYYLDLDYQKISKKNSTEIVRELTLSPQFFSRFIVMSMLLVSSEFLIIILTIIAIGVYDIKVFLLLICSVFPIAFLFHRLVKGKLRSYGEQQNTETPKLHSNSNRGIFGFIDVKLRNKERVLLDDYIRVFKKLNKINVVTNILNIFPAKLFELVTVAGLLVIYIYGAFLADNPDLVLPLIAIYAAAGYRIIPSLSKVLPSLMMLEQYAYLFEVYKAPLKHKDTSECFKKNALVNFDESINLKNVSFRYEGESKYLFKDLNLSIKKAEVIGVIGKSGFGKTTLIKLITGFLKPEKGSVNVDSVAITDDNLRGWMQQISYVQQSPYLEKGSLTANIAFLDEVVDYDRLKKVIEMSSLADFVGNKSVDEIFIDEDGKNLSGGQKQRVVIARALYNNSKLIVFDEATSALDNKTEEEVNETIKKLKGTGVTIIIIAHRYSTLVYTDRILELTGDYHVIESKYA